MGMYEEEEYEKAEQENIYLNILQYCQYNCSLCYFYKNPIYGAIIEIETNVDEYF
jgi:2-iminoacetate synthase ThiH